MIIHKKVLMNMKNKPKSALNTIDIERVKELFPQKQIPLPHNEVTLPFSHECSLVKLPRSALSLDLLLIKSKADKTKKKLKSFSSLNQKELSAGARNAQKCCANQKDFLILNDNAFGSGLNPERVRNWKLKEYLLASRNLKKMRSEQEKGKKSSDFHNVTLIDKLTPKSEERQNMEQWQELLKLKEERHFHLTRITKFLID
jgi:hypothetical protein